MDNGPEFISRSLDLWAYWNGVKLGVSRSGKPTDNALIESFNGKLRASSPSQRNPKPLRLPLRVEAAVRRRQRNEMLRTD
jgi:transposase InsO family protein